MPVKDPRETFVTLLSAVRHNSERASKFYDEVSQHAQDPEVKQILESRGLISDQILARLDRCFSLLGEKPVKFTGRLQDIFVEDFRNELAEIQSPVARHLFILSKLVHITHLRIGEYVALTAAADLTGNYAIGSLLETCLADKLALAERARRAIRHIVEEKVMQRRAA